MKKLRVLITSGGTKVPIDAVRSIRNMSSGTFGAALASEFLRRGHTVTFLKAVGSKSPFTAEVDLYQQTGWKSLWSSFWNYLRFVPGLNYQEFQYTTFDEYQLALRAECTCTSFAYDLVLLAAAVSDYKVSNVVAGKIRTAGDMTLQLEPYPKLIEQVNSWVPPHTKIVGFKLLVNSTDMELHQAAVESLKKNHCDLIVANDLRDIKQGKHRVMLVHEKYVKTRTTGEIPGVSLAASVVDHSIQLVSP